MSGEETDCEVAIVGCGPVGAIAANLFGHAGLRTVVIEREREPYPLPRAVHIDHEMMRIFQSVRLADAVLPLMREAQGHIHIGADGGVIRYLGSAGCRSGSAGRMTTSFSSLNSNRRCRQGCPDFLTWRCNAAWRSRLWSRRWTGYG